MNLAPVLKLAGVVAISCAVLAVMAVWLLLSEPVSVASAVNTGDASALLTAIEHALSGTLRVVLSYL